MGELANWIVEMIAYGVLMVFVLGILLRPSGKSISPYHKCKVCGSQVIAMRSCPVCGVVLH